MVMRLRRTSRAYVDAANRRLRRLVLGFRSFGVYGKEKRRPKAPFRSYFVLFVFYLMRSLNAWSATLTTNTPVVFTRIWLAAVLR